MLTKQFWKQTIERAIKTFAQTSLALIAVDGLGITDLAWGHTLDVAGLATLASVLTSIVTSGVGEPDSPSAVKAE
ncbi:holin [Actinoplanes sp. TBRC 11911]|uniref:holin n=1 Tax=Actinoplanes sp. TBRC 11911 TaxID=2729386 RepID=UPI00145F0D6A|nr:holin [Actinoplanes sp. TBRC 11911]NMO52039.1 holin [Actinoplanes sp. TBRC 11911]